MLTKADIFAIEFWNMKLNVALTTAKITGERFIVTTDIYEPLKAALRVAGYDCFGKPFAQIAVDAKQIIDDWNREHAHATAS